MEKSFNIAGPCFPEEHYMLPPLDRIPGIVKIVERRNYFVIHAARQSGKTTVLQTLVKAINAKGEMMAVYFTVESAQPFVDPAEGIAKIVERMRTDLMRHPVFGPVVADASDVFMRSGVKPFLSRLAETAGKPLAIFFDEVDALSDGTLIAFLRELRDGYVTRGTIPFPASVALVGMRDIRDYKARVRPDSQTLGSASPFNIISEDLTIRNFSEKDVAALYAQHAAATGQAFADGAAEEAYRLTCGQPWLVNALARECVAKIHEYRYDEPITAEDIDTAKETIIRARGTHVDSLMERLKEDRVRRVVEPVILGKDAYPSAFDDDYRYVLDLGILKECENHMLIPANPMYAEIMLRYLSEGEQKRFYNDYQLPFWQKDDGSLDMPALMAEFQRFWRENSEASREIYGYKEAMPHLVLMAFLQRVVNGGGRIVREMALGSGRLDLCVEYMQFRYAVELKMRSRYSREKSLTQFAGYLERLGLAEGWMPVFDEDKSKSWDEKLFLRDESVGGRTIHVVGL